jgi:hypothetical protein
MEKYTDFIIDLREEQAECVINNINFNIKFQVYDYVCEYDSMRFEFLDDDLGEFIAIEPKDLEKHGITLDIYDSLHDEINKEVEYWYYENYEVDPDENIEFYLEQKQKSFNY